MVKAVVGCTWGDEGKGKITDWLSKESDIVIRYQGGSNAGHTILNDYGRFVLHLLPSGVFHKQVTNIIGPGVALHIQNLLKELGELQKNNIVPNLLISDRAQLVMPWHILFDQLEEKRLSDKNFGSTKSGIAPFYSDKYAKVGIQVCDLFYPEILEEKIHGICAVKNILLKHLYKAPPIQPDRVVDEFLSFKEKLRPFVADVSQYLHEALKSNKKILLEGQLGALKDPDHGIYPMTTSSSTLAGFASAGAGIPPYKIENIIAVVKAYSSCVGAGEFVTEIFGQEADTLRRLGGDKGEFGATTGRPRRMGWFDGVANRYGCMVQGATEAALTNIDVLGYLDEIPVCTAYEIDGHTTKAFPVTPQLKKAKPVYTKLTGWKSDIRGVQSYSALPAEAKAYINFIEQYLETPIRYISTGPERDDVIMR